MEELLPYIGLTLIVLGTITGGYLTIKYRNQVTEKQNKIVELNQEIDSVGKENRELNNQIKTISENIESVSKRLEEVSTTTKDVVIKNNELADKTSTLTDQNITLTKVVRDLNTGGIGFMDIRDINIVPYDQDARKNGHRVELNINLFNNGKFAFDEVKIRAYPRNNYLLDYPVFIWTDISSSGLNIKSRFPSRSPIYKPKSALIESDYSVIKPNQSISLTPFGSQNDFVKFGLDIFIESKRQDWIVLIRFQRPKDKSKPLFIYRILKLNGDGIEEVFQSENIGFPRFDNGKTKWYKEEIPEHWFSK